MAVQFITGPAGSGKMINNSELDIGYTNYNTYSDIKSVTGNLIVANGGIIDNSNGFSFNVAGADGENISTAAINGEVTGGMKVGKYAKVEVGTGGEVSAAGDGSRAIYNAGGTVTVSDTGQVTASGTDVCALYLGNYSTLTFTGGELRASKGATLCDQTLGYNVTEDEEWIYVRLQSDNTIA